MLHRLYLLGALAALTVSGTLYASTAAADDPRSMPPSMVQGDKSAITEHFFGSGEVVHRVTADAWVAPSANTNKKATGDSAERSKALQIGYPREIPANLRGLPLTTLPWQTLADGSRVARVEVVATEAAAFRIGYRVDGPAAGLQVRFSGIGRDEVYSVAVTGSDRTWSPVLEGDTATLELRVLPGFDAAQFQVTLDKLSHLLTSPASLGQKDVRDIGKAGACNIDIACVSNASSALLNTVKAVAKAVYTDSANGRTYACTGTLLNSTSGANFFYTAAHCISTQASASTISTYWFFDAVSCNSGAIPPYQLVNGGADLLVTDLTTDATLLQLRQSPPIGAFRAAWNATVIPTGTNIVGLHHPQGDLKKFSQGDMLGYAKGPLAYSTGPRPQAGKDSFITVQWAQGTTEEGSSGSGVFTYNATCGGGAPCYELRGGLEGGAASCSTPTGADRFSRMDLMFTQLAPYLKPSAVIPVSTSAKSSMVEFYNPQSDFYFISSRESEKRILDTLADGNFNYLWYRTGYWFKTDPAPSSLTAALTRYFIPGAAKAGTRGSHFYTVLNSDRAFLTSTGKERFANPSFGCDGVPNGYFCNEGTDSFIAPPLLSAGVNTCLDSERKIYRAFRADSARYFNDGNHRYLTDATMYAYMVNDLGWAAEGVAFCATP